MINLIGSHEKKKVFYTQKKSVAAKLMRIMGKKFLNYGLDSITIKHFPNNKLFRLNNMWVSLSFM